jgi:hypothetical protein
MLADAIAIDRAGDIDLTIEQIQAGLSEGQRSVLLKALNFDFFVREIARQAAEHAEIQPNTQRNKPDDN